MKIDIDINRSAFGPAKLPKVKPFSSAGTPSVTDSKHVNSKIQGLARDRGAIDALIIAQMAREFMQKAIVISSRLQGVAMEAMASGKMNAGEFGETLSSINDSLRKMDSGFAPSIASLGSESSVESVKDIPDIRPDVKAMKEFAVDLDAGRVKDSHNINRITESLERKESEMPEIVKKLGDSLSQLFGNAVSGRDMELPVFAERTAGQILENPDAAFAAQGNLNHETVAFVI